MSTAAVARSRDDTTPEGMKTQFDIDDERFVKIFYMGVKRSFS